MEKMVIVREFNREEDEFGVEMVEKSWEVGGGGKMSLFTHMMGDPICRVRHSPAFLMLVAEMGVDKEIVGLIRGSIKMVTCGKKISKNGKKVDENVVFVPVSTKLGYILGLRVSPFHRRMGIGLKLVSHIEDWFRENGVEYSYMATEKGNEASMKLFTNRCDYIKLRTSSILVQPVFAHRVKISKRVIIFALGPLEAEILYRRRFSTTEFFPQDIDSVLNNKLNLGTFVAIPADTYRAKAWLSIEHFLAEMPESWAVLSVWNSKEVYKFELRGASPVRKGFAKITRIVDSVFPWIGIPSVPDLFRPFGFYFLYGLGGEGADKVKLVRALCRFGHNMAKAGGCGVVATEVASFDPLRLGIPHWKRLSCTEDQWCIKRLMGNDYFDGGGRDWTKSLPESSIFVDPREV